VIYFLLWTNLKYVFIGNAHTLEIVGSDIITFLMCEIINGIIQKIPYVKELKKIIVY